MFNIGDEIYVNWSGGWTKFTAAGIGKYPFNCSAKSDFQNDMVFTKPTGLFVYESELQHFKDNKYFFKIPFRDKE